MISNERIIAALLENPTARAAAKSLGISEVTVYRRLADPGFKKAYDTRRRQLVEVICGALQNRMGEAVEALSEIINDNRASKMARAKAAETILQYGIKTLETLDLMPRVEALMDAEERRNA